MINQGIHVRRVEDCHPQEFFSENFSGWFFCSCCSCLVRVKFLRSVRWAGMFPVTRAAASTGRARKSPAACRSPGPRRRKGLTVNDADFTINETNARNAGVLIGAYHFAHPETHVGLAGADPEAAHFWSIAGNYIKRRRQYLCRCSTWNGLEHRQPGLHADHACHNGSTAGAGHRESTPRPTASPSSRWFTRALPIPRSWLNSTVTNWPLWMANWPSSPQSADRRAEQQRPVGTWTVWQYCRQQFHCRPGQRLGRGCFQRHVHDVSAHSSSAAVPAVFHHAARRTAASWTPAATSVFSATADGSLPLKLSMDF